MRRFWRLGVVLLAAAVSGAVMLMSTSSAQIPSPPSVPNFTFPTLPSPPTMPPFTTRPTSPPPTMPPQTSTSLSSPPTMPPTTIDFDDDRLDDRIEGIIDQLERFGEQFADVIQELREIQNEF
jgi:hypothetical protein